MPQVNVSIVSKDNIFIASKYAIFSYDSFLYLEVLRTMEHMYWQISLHDVAHVLTDWYLALLCKSNEHVENKRDLSCTKSSRLVQTCNYC